MSTLVLSGDKHDHRYSEFDLESKSADSGPFKVTESDSDTFYRLCCANVDEYPSVATANTNNFFMLMIIGYCLGGASTLEKFKTACGRRKPLIEIPANS